MLHHFVRILESPHLSPRKQCQHVIEVKLHANPEVSDSHGISVPNGTQGSAKPPNSARPSTRTFECVSSARQRVQQGRRNSLSDLPTSTNTGGIEQGRRAGNKRAYSSVSVDTGSAGTSGTASTAARKSDATAATAAAVAEATACWIAVNGGKALLSTTRQNTGQAGGAQQASASHVKAADHNGGYSKDIKTASFTGNIRGYVGKGGGSLAQDSCGVASAGAVSDVDTDHGVQALETKMSRVTIAALRGERDKKRVRFNDDRLEETLKPRNGATCLPASYPLDLNSTTPAAGSQSAPSEAINPITGTRIHDGGALRRDFKAQERPVTSAHRSDPLGHAGWESDAPSLEQVSSSTAALGWSSTPPLRAALSPARTGQTAKRGHQARGSPGANVDAENGPGPEERIGNVIAKSGQASRPADDVSACSAAPKPFRSLAGDRQEGAARYHHRHPPGLAPDARAPRARRVHEQVTGEFASLR